jgi:MFS family permease
LLEAAAIVDARRGDARSLDRDSGRSRSVAVLIPIMVVVLTAFLTIGFALPVLPLHVHQGLGFGTFAVGLVPGSQFIASLISRMWSGEYADRRGAKRAVLAGLLMAAVAGLLYLLSVRVIGAPWLSVGILLLGRALLGGAESLVITGAFGWGLTLVGSERTGRVVAWVGMAMFAALALGAPIGTALYAVGGFAAVALATTLVPVVATLLVALLSAVPLQPGARPALIKLVGAVWTPGLGAARSSIGFGAILAFSALLFAERGRNPVWLPFSAFAASLVTARALFGHMPDRSILIEAAGLALVWCRSRSWLRSGRRSPGSAIHSSTRSSASKPFAALRLRVAAWQWGPIPSFSTWRSDSAVLCWGLSQAGRGSALYSSPARSPCCAVRPSPCDCLLPLGPERKTSRSDSSP